ncbi:DUF3137 domain-containing protein [Shewanella psychrotolerans]|uniref:DUF3137 domain-containing protein n=1 Tax=Shewanella psychrotolerans TaxID=2864206 RepID=UPI001C659C02|nr:DUF3137 domain-containing protein [Shewanella psychrotolerans]QYK00176.1 DUF3137 domain-containing protein [Shewanella psychrotolerans]
MNPMEFDVPEKDKLSFSQYYKRNIAPKCASYEKMRLDAVKRYNERAKIAKPLGQLVIPLFLVGFAVMYYSLAVLDDGQLFTISLLGTMTVFAMIAGVYVWACGEVTKLSKDIFGELYPILIRYFGKEFKLNPPNLPELETYKDYGILPKYDRGYFKDSFKGKYQGIKFLLRELGLDVNDGTNNDNQTRYKNIFNGILIEFDISKRFSGITLISKDRGMFGNKLDAFKSDLSRVRLEDVRFEREFEVYSSDQVEARYLLNTATMERLLSIGRFYNSELEACFKDGKLLLKIASSHDYFQSNLDIQKELSFQEDIEQLFKELEEIFALINTLKLNQYTGL